MLIYIQRERMTIHVQANTGPHSQVKEGMGVRFSCAGGKGVVINICLRSQQSNQYFYSLHIEVPKNSWACSLLYPRPLVPCSPPPRPAPGVERPRAKY